MKNFLPVLSFFLISWMVNAGTMKEGIVGDYELTIGDDTEVISLKKAGYATWSTDNLAMEGGAMDCKGRYWFIDEDLGISVTCPNGATILLMVSLKNILDFSEFITPVHIKAAGEHLSFETIAEASFKKQ